MIKIKFLFFIVLNFIILVVNIVRCNVQAQTVEERGYIKLSKLSGKLLTPEQGCGVSTVPTSRIVGGTDAELGSFPWMALIIYSDQDNGKKQYHYDCGGSLITSRHVLTAAHCIISRPEYVRLGDHDLTSKKDGTFQQIKVKTIIRHERFTLTTLANDIAILTLERDVTFSEKIRPICLPLDEKMRNRRLVGKKPTVIGWGYMNTNGPAAIILQHIQIPVLAGSYCAKSFGKRFSDKAQICAGNVVRGEGTCKGDSGGPLMLPASDNKSMPVYQIGIVSYGKMKCEQKNAGEVLVSVPYYMDWIKSHLN